MIVLKICETQRATASKNTLGNPVLRLELVAALPGLSSPDKELGVHMHTL